MAGFKSIMLAVLYFLFIFPLFLPYFGLNICYLFIMEKRKYKEKNSFYEASLILKAKPNQFQLQIPK